jgi:GNAT superfamily N-acetyltransferase
MDVRAATADDAREVVRLGRLMFEAMGIDASGEEWQREGERHVRQRLGRDLAVFVAAHPEIPNRLVASAAGTIAARLPGPRNSAGRVGYVQWVSTEPDFRRRGLCRRLMESLLAWYGANEVDSVELHATPDGEPLYRSLGFSDGGARALRRSARPLSG